MFLRTNMQTRTFRDLSLFIIANFFPPSWIGAQASLSHPPSYPPCSTVAEYTKHTNLVVLLVPALTYTILSLPPLLTSATENPRLPIRMPLPSDPPYNPSKQPKLPSFVDSLGRAATLYGSIPFIAHTFFYGCPTRAPGDTIRMHCILNTFLQTPVSGEEKERHILFWFVSLTFPRADRLLVLQWSARGPRTRGKLFLTTEKMVEHNYRFPLYLAEVCQNPEGRMDSSTRS